MTDATDATRERNVVQRALDARFVEKRALHWATRYSRAAREDDLVEVGNGTLVTIVRKYDVVLGSFDDYCQRRLDWKMLSAVRVEARAHRLDRAAWRATAELLAMLRFDRKTTADERFDRLADFVAAATFVAMTEEALRGGDEDMARREEYATAHVVLKEALEAQPRPKRRLLGLLYVDEITQEEAAQRLGASLRTIERWHHDALAELKKRLALKGYTQAPDRAGGPRFEVLEGGDEDADPGDGGKTGPRPRTGGKGDGEAG